MSGPIYRPNVPIRQHGAFYRPATVNGLKSMVMIARLNTFKETIAYYVNNGSTVYCTILDATKAFDWVKYGKLFWLLASRDLPPAWLLLLVNMYTNRSTQIA